MVAFEINIYLYLFLKIYIAAVVMAEVMECSLDNPRLIGGES